MNRNGSPGRSLVLVAAALLVLAAPATASFNCLSRGIQRVHLQQWASSSTGGTCNPFSGMAAKESTTDHCVPPNEPFTCDGFISKAKANVYCPVSNVEVRCIVPTALQKLAFGAYIQPASCRNVSRAGNEFACDTYEVINGFDFTSMTVSCCTLVGFTPPATPAPAPQPTPVQPAPQPTTPQPTTQIPATPQPTPQPTTPQPSSPQLTTPEPTTKPTEALTTAAIAPPQTTAGPPTTTTTPQKPSPAPATTAIPALPTSDTPKPPAPTTFAPATPVTTDPPTTTGSQPTTETSPEATTKASTPAPTIAVTTVQDTPKPQTPSPSTEAPAPLNTSEPLRECDLSITFGLDVDELSVSSLLELVETTLGVLPSETVQVKSVAAGSVVVVFTIVTRRPAADVEKIFRVAVNDPSHPLCRDYHAIHGSVSVTERVFHDEELSVYMLVGFTVTIALSAIVIVAVYVYRRRAGHLDDKLKTVGKATTTVENGCLIIDGKTLGNSASQLEESNTTVELQKASSLRRRYSAPLRLVGSPKQKPSRVNSLDNESFGSSNSFEFWQPRSEDVPGDVPPGEFHGLAEIPDQPMVGDEPSPPLHHTEGDVRTQQSNEIQHQ